MRHVGAYHSVDAVHAEVRRRYAAAARAAPETICRHCGAPHAAHGQLAFTCPPSRAGRRRGMFEAVELQRHDEP